jgi:hypothetical protein
MVFLLVLCPFWFLFLAMTAAPGQSGSRVPAGRPASPLTEAHFENALQMHCALHFTNALFNAL